MSRQGFLSVPRLAFGLAVLVIVGFVAVRLASPTTHASVRLVRISGYPLDDAPAAAAAFDGNKVIVLGTVVEFGAPRWTSPDTKEPNRFIYTPVRLRVDRSFRGTIQEGSTILVRGLGGRVDDVAHEFDDMPSVVDFERDAQVLVFLGDARDTGNGHPARTPNMIYDVSAATEAISRDGEHRISITEFATLLAGGD